MTGTRSNKANACGCKYNSYSYSLSRFNIYINITTLTHSPFHFPLSFHFCSRFPFLSSFSYVHCYCYCLLRHYQRNTEHITNSNFKSMNHHSAFRSRSTTLRTMKMKHLLNLLFLVLVLLLLLFLWLFHYLAKTLECVDITTAKQIHNLTVAVAVNVREKKSSLCFVMLAS